VTKPESAFDMKRQVFLGTANFTQSYGLSKVTSGLSEGVIHEILDQVEVDEEIHLDTAPQYGTSELLLGKLGNSRRFMQRITSKIPHTAYGSSNAIIESVKNSLVQLKISSFENVMLHGISEEMERNLGAIREGLISILNLGLTRHVGLSCYTEAEVIYAKEKLPMLKLFQVPENVADRRLIGSEELKKLSQKGNRFLVRSVFLQGRLLQNSTQLSSEFPELLPFVTDLNLSAKEQNLSKLEYCLAYTRSIPWASGIVVGVETSNQLTQILTSYRKSYPEIVFDNRKIDSPTVDPRNWKNEM
jgi:aryl-alcohol dehydrogenase-like predicted oxidoreductase